MGQRANLVVIRNGKWQLYYDHWCANRLEEELFWGPGLALEFIEQRDDDAGWLDEIWCEGAALLDLDDRVLIFFGGEDILYDVPLRRAYLALMQANWPGWEIRWAHRELVSLTDYLGLDKAIVLSGKKHDLNAAAFGWNTDFPQDNLVLITTIRNGAATAWRVCGMSDTIAAGPRSLDGLGSIKPLHGLVWTLNFPQSGFHVDFDRKALAFWCSDTQADLLEKTEAAWPGWSVRWLLDEFEQHIALCGLDIRLPERSMADLQREIIARLRDSHRAEPSNPAMSLALQRELGKNIEVNPATSIGRASAGGEAEKQAILDRLEARLPVLPGGH